MSTAKRKQIPRHLRPLWKRWVKAGGWVETGSHLKWYDHRGFLRVVTGATPKGYGHPAANTIREIERALNEHNQEGT